MIKAKYDYLVFRRGLRGNINGGFYKLFEHSSHQLVPQIINNGENFNLFAANSG